MSDEALLVATNLAQPCEVEMSIGMRRVKFETSLVGLLRSVITLQLFENDRPIEVQ
jgi:hypothetical protein